MLWDYLDGRLPAAVHREIAAHLATCAGCPSHFQFARTIQQALASSAPPLASDAQGEQLRWRVRAALRAIAGDDRRPIELESGGCPPDP